MRHPALFVGACLFLGSSIALQKSFLSPWDVCCLPLFVLIFPGFRLLWAVLLIAISCWSTASRVHIPSDPGRYNGTLLCEVVDRYPVFFHGQTLCKVALSIQDFSSQEHSSLLRGLTVPVTIKPTCALSGGVLYCFPARVDVDENLRPHLYVFPNGSSAQKSLCSLVEPRLSFRKFLERRFVSLYPDPHLRQVAGGLAFGLYKDPLVQKAMHLAGVEHVLAVSGFHFGIVAALTVFLANRAGTRLRSIIAMICLTLYFFIVGPLPSVLRAWSAAMVVLAGLCFRKRSDGLNCLGVGCIISVLYDPYSIGQIGYQLSYLATAAILFFSKTTLTFLREHFISRTADEAVLLSPIDQILLWILERIVPALSLLIPVFCLLLPYQLAFLQDFSLLGLIYNLIIPALFSLAMPAILLAVVTSFVPFLSQSFVFLSTLPLTLGLFLVENTPETSWSLLSGGILPQTLARIIISSLLLFGIVLSGQSSIDRTDSWKACL